MLLGVGRKAAAEYSFFAAMPVLGAAAGYDLFASRDILTPADVPLFAVGALAAFVSAWFAIRFFLRLLAKITLRPFAWYRIVAGTALLVVIHA
jgi:undecaprenyl-diphosphatase